MVARDQGTPWGARHAPEEEVWQSLAGQAENTARPHLILWLGGPPWQFLEEDQRASSGTYLFR